MSELPIVRHADRSDADQVMEMCRELHAENGLFSFSEKKVRGCMDRCFNREGGILGVIGASGELEASICLVLADNYYTEDMNITELWNYVRPEHRKKRNAEALLTFAVDCQKRLGLPLITGIITNTRTAGKVRLYRKILGYPAGAFFVSGGKWSGTQPSMEDFWKPFESRGEQRRRERLEKRNGAA